MKKMISRRNFLKVCAVAGSAVALSACGGSKSNNSGSTAASGAQAPNCTRSFQHRPDQL
jgi:oligopeptide transport system substrate-binding protein